MSIRQRKVCAKCGSMTLRKYKSGIYKCVQCLYESENPPMKEVNCFRSNEVTDERLLKIKKVHDENQNYTQKQLMTFANETEHAVRKYWRNPVFNTVAQYQNGGV